MIYINFWFTFLIIKEDMRDMGKIDMNKQTDDTNKTKENAKKSGKKAVVTYAGGGIWQDSDGKYWAREPKGATIKSERQYTEEEYNNHKDIQFMVEYGEMKVTFVE